MTINSRGSRTAFRGIHVVWWFPAVLFLCVMTPLVSWSAVTLSPEMEKDLGQMLIVGFRGLSVDEASPVIRDIRKRNIGGVILFDYDVPAGSPVRNIASPVQVRALTDALQAAAATPLFIAVDQEGGKICRLKTRFGFPPTVSAEYLGGLDDPAAIRRYAMATAETLHEAGINVNFAPVVDLNRNPSNPVIGMLERSYSADPAVVVRHAMVVIEALHGRRILSTLKHFPGHGSSAADSHLGVVDVTRTWDPVELVPFERIIQSGACDMVMTAHIFNGNLDSRRPATLSAKTITGILREKLGYDGVVVSDDMQMGAIRSFYGLEAAIRMALEAGCDILVFANNSVFEEDIAERAVGIIRKLVADGTVTPGKIGQSLGRIKKLKERISPAP